MRGRRREHSCEWRSRVTVACAELDRQGREGSQYVLIGRMVHLLDPAGKLIRPPPVPDPRADPLLGTMPVAAAAYAEPDVISCGRCGNRHDSRDACPTRSPSPPPPAAA